MRAYSSGTGVRTRAQRQCAARSVFGGGAPVVLTSTRDPLLDGLARASRESNRHRADGDTSSLVAGGRELPEALGPLELLRGDRRRGPDHRENLGGVFH